MSRFGASLLFLGIASFVLPMIGMQFNFIEAIGPEKQPLVGGGLIVLGLLSSIGGAAIDGPTTNE